MSLSNNKEIDEVWKKVSLGNKLLAMYVEDSIGFTLDISNFIYINVRKYKNQEEVLNT